MVGAEVETFLGGGDDCGGDDGVGVAVESGGVFAEEIGVRGAVGGEEGGVVGGGYGEGEGGVEEDGAGVAACGRSIHTYDLCTVA